MSKLTSLALTMALIGAALGGSLATGQEYTSTFDRSLCHFSSTGNNPFLPLLPGLIVTLEGEEEDEGEIVEGQAIITVLAETEVVDGVTTRVIEERESEDGEITEISRNFMAICRETGDVWYFGEDVDIYEDGEIVSHDGQWRAGVDGASPGLLMLGSPLLGARFMQEVAPGIAEDRSEIVAIGGDIDVPAGSFSGVLETLDTDALSPSSADIKVYARGLGLIKDEHLELVEYELPACVPDETTHCLNNGRFRVEAEWTDFEHNSGDAQALLAGGDSGEFWFFAPDNTELIVKVLDGCVISDHYWVFAAGLTNVGVVLTVTDTEADEESVYVNPLGGAFMPVLDTAAFATCP